MKVDISHSQTPPTNDLLNLPDIDGVFNEVKGPSVPQPSQTAPKTVQPKIHNMSVTDIINAALRAFIGTNSGYLKEFLRSNDYIVNNLQNHV